MSFVKFVSKEAPEPRYDIALQYRTIPGNENNDEEEDKKEDNNK